MGGIGVTGSSGLLGRSVVAELLAAGHRVVGADRAPATVEADGFSACAWDGRDVSGLAANLEGCDGLVHLAAIPAPYHHPNETVFGNNTAATFAALQAAADRGIRRAVVASSISVYGMAFSPKPLAALYVPVDEAHPLRNADPYGLSKEADEATARMFCRRYGMSVAALRFHWVADPAAQLGSRSLRGELGDTSEIANLWGYVDSRDAARACRLALEAAAERTYGFAALNIAAADVLARVPLGELIERFAPAVEVRTPLGQTAGGWDISRAEQLIGWHPEHSWRDLAP